MVYYKVDNGILISILIFILWFSLFLKRGKNQCLVFSSDVSLIWSVDGNWYYLPEPPLS